MIQKDAKTSDLTSISLNLYPRNTFEDNYVPLNPFVPERPLKQEWTFIRSDQFLHRPGSKMDPFPLYLEEVAKVRLYFKFIS